MVKPLQSLELLLGHPLVEKLCDRSLKDGVKFNEEAPIHFKKEVLEEDRIKFKQALRVLHAIVNNSTSLRYPSDENQKLLEDLAQDLAQAKKIANEQIEKTLEIVSISDVDVDFEAFKNLMLKVDFVARDRQHENIPPKPARKIQKRKRRNDRGSPHNTP
ncbi:hypothetical protein ACOWL5_04500 [Helicobacter pylori]